MATISRISPYNITDDLRRAELYREIRAGQKKDEWPIYEIQAADILKPELIAYKVYGTKEMKWLIMVAAGLNDMREAMEAAVSLRLPDVSWVRQRIKFHSEIEKKLAAQ